MNNINAHYEYINFKLPQKQKTLAWIRQIIESNHFNHIQLNYIFCSDNYLLEINQQYLDHDCFTDIITFDHSEKQNEISGDIYISIDRIKDNAYKMNLDFQDELHRVMVHGILHLLGFDDKTETQKSEMRKIEDHYLALREFI